MKSFIFAAVGVGVGVATVFVQAASAEVTRRDLARSYVAFEQVLAASPPEDQAKVRVSREFDRITGMAFRSRHAEAALLMDDLADSLRPAWQTTPSSRASRALRVTADPPLASIDAPGVVRLHVTPRRPLPEGTGALALRVAGPSGETVASWAWTPGPGGEGMSFEWRPPAGRAGRYTLETAPGDPHDPASREWAERGEWHGVAELPSAVRARWSPRVETLLADASIDAGLRRAALAARSRLGLLADDPSTLDPAHVLLDVSRLVEELPAEVEALEAGRDPYAWRAGDYWRSVDDAAGRLRLPARFYAPEAAMSAMREGRRVPLVIALHGAGGNEALFMDGYGGGLLKRLAERYGFVVVSPLTYPALTDIRSLAATIEVASAAYAIDPGRVYAVGHSLGAITAAMWAGNYRDVLAGVALIAGGRPHVQLLLPPMKGGEAGDSPIVRAFVAGGEFDRIFPPASLGAATRRLAEAGGEAVYREFAGDGHVTLVGGALEEAIPWLLGVAAEEQAGVKVEAVGHHPLPAGESGAIELSGITRVDDSTYLVVSDKRGMLHRLEVEFDGGRVASTRLSPGLHLEGGVDLEGVAYDAGAGVVYVADEASSAVRGHDPATGEVVETLPVPRVFGRVRPNLGLESLTLTPGGGSLWTANEEALPADGGRSTTEAGSRVRLLRLDREGQDWSAGAQFVYETDPVSGTNRLLRSGNSGVVELLAVDATRLLVLERELGVPGRVPRFRSRLYLVETADGQDVSDRASVADATPLQKSLVWEGEFAADNFEGMTWGPRVEGGRLLLLVSDDNAAGAPVMNQSLLVLSVRPDPLTADGGQAWR